jgi:hypothetical protein
VTDCPPAFNCGIDQESEAPEEFGRIARVKIAIDFFQGQFMRVGERYDGRARVLLAKTSDEIQFVFLRNAVAEDEQIEPASLASFGTAMEPEGGRDLVTLAREQKFPRAQKRRIVGDRENTGQKSIPPQMNHILELLTGILKRRPGL